MSIDFSRLLPLGWSNFFSTQIPLEALDRVRPARVVRVERDRVGRHGAENGCGQ
jgi:ribosome biogenesis GTPase